MNFRHHTGTLVLIGCAIICEAARSVPMGRAGTPEEIAATVLWLCSPGASYIAGQALTVDGGMTGH